MTATLDRLGEGIETVPAPVEAGPRKFRPDIQGLRAVAVVLVVLYHSGVPGVTGGYVGVDVFFVISGFLITRQLTTELLANGRISLAGFYARRIKRLLPPALTVILVTTLVARIWGPALQAADIARDGIFSTFYFMNYHLAAEGVDYQNADGPVSPFQHFWSLAVEEQFYLFWPLIIIVVGLVFRRLARVGLVLVAVAGVAVSFVISVDLTRTTATFAYFAIQSRAWELGVGAVVALSAPLWQRLPAVAAAVSGWVGLAVIIGSAFVFTDRTPFPGSAAAVPVIGAALVVLSGVVRRGGGVEVALGGRLMQFVGRVSYGWYLWHWPLIVLAPSLFGTPFGWAQNLEVAVLGLWLAVLTYLVIEQVAARRRLTKGRWIIFGAGMSAVVTGAAVLVIAIPPLALANSGAVSPLNLAGTSPAALSALLNSSYESKSVPANLTPELTVAGDDLPPTSLDGCHASYAATTEPPCVFGDPTGDRTIVLFGDSHAEQWFGALNALAKDNGWKLMSWTKAACPLADVVLYNPKLQRDYTECGQWRMNVLSRIAALHPDLVIAGGSDALPGPAYPNASWSAQTATNLAVLKSSADRVVYMADTPRPTSNVPTCIAAHIDTAQKCEFTRRSQTEGTSSKNNLPTRHGDVLTAARATGVQVLDPTNWFCTSTSCPVIVKNTLLYRDDSHITQSYSKALEPVVGRALGALVPWMAKS